MKTYINIAVSSIFAVLLAYALVISPAFALEVSDNENTAAPSARDNGDTSSPNTQDNRDTAATPSPVKTAPPVRDNGDTSTPNTQDNGTTADPKAPGTRDNGDTSAPNANDNGDTSGNPGVTNPDNNNNNGGGGGGGGSRRNRTNTDSPVFVSGSDCPYITTYMRLGAKNDSKEVTKLQTFLKNNEKFNVDINGTFDLKTFDAVKAFQGKYMNEIMLPWGSNTPSGNVFITTQKKINELVCKSPLALNAGELAQIEAYKNSLNQEDSTVEAPGADTIDNPSVEVGGETKDNPQTASAFEASILGKIWKFIKWLFGY